MSKADIPKDTPPDGVANKISPDSMWWTGLGRMGYGNGWSGSHFNRIDNYGFSDPGATGDAR